MKNSPTDGGCLWVLVDGQARRNKDTIESRHKKIERVYVVNGTKKNSKKDVQKSRTLSGCNIVILVQGHC